MTSRVARVGAPLLVVVSLLAACGSGATSSGGGSSRGGGAASDAELTYGFAPIDGAPGVEYQPDVVIVGGGAASIKAAGVDGITWLIDGNAAHVDRIAVGRLLFVTSRAVGRVLATQKQGSDVAVVLGPFDITELIKNGHIDVEQSIDVSAMSLQTRPGTPDVFTPKPPPSPSAAPAAPAPTATTAFDGGQTLPTIHLLAMPRHAAVLADSVCYIVFTCSGSLPPAERAHSVKVAVPPFVFEAEATTAGRETEIKATIGYKNSGVEVAAVVTVAMEDPKVHATTDIEGGKLLTGKASISGLKSVDVSVGSGSEPGLSGNFGGRLVVPIEFNIPFPGSPPIELTVGFKSSVELAHSSKNSNLTTEGKVELTGPVGVTYTEAGGTSAEDGGAHVTQDPVEKLEGTSVGIASMVFAFQVKFLVGLGGEAFSAGPFATATISLGLTNGSSIGIVKCRQASVDVLLGGGFGYRLEEGVAGLLTKFGYKNATEGTFIGFSKSVIHTVQVRPQVQACGG